MVFIVVTFCNEHFCKSRLWFGDLCDLFIIINFAALDLFGGINYNVVFINVTNILLDLVDCITIKGQHWKGWNFGGEIMMVLTQ